MLTPTKKLEYFKTTKRLPQAILLITPEKSKKEEILNNTLKAFTDDVVSEAKGNLIIVGSLEDEALSIKVDDVREVLEKLSLSRWDGGVKRFVYIPGAEHLTASSSNALLKSLEEPGEGTHFILTAPSRRSVLKTILSRCSVINFYEDEEIETRKQVFEKAQLFFDAFFKGEFEPLEKLNKADFKIAFEDFKVLLKDKFIEESYSGDLNRAYWYELFDFLERCEAQITSHTDNKWIIRAIETFYGDHS